MGLELNQTRTIWISEGFHPGKGKVLWHDWIIYYSFHIKIFITFLSIIYSVMEFTQTLHLLDNLLSFHQSKVKCRGGGALFLQHILALEGGRINTRSTCLKTHSLSARNLLSMSKYLNQVSPLTGVWGETVFVVVMSIWYDDDF